MIKKLKNLLSDHHVYIDTVFLGGILYILNLSILPTRESQTIVTLMFYFYLKLKNLILDKEETKE